MKIVVRAPNWIGDAVLALPAVESLCHSSPEAEIWVAGYAHIKDLFLSLESVKGFIPLPGSGRADSLLAAVKALRKGRFDAGILLTNSFSSALVFSLAGIPQRWGYSRDGRGFLLTKKIPFKKTGKGIHQGEYYLNLISGLGFKAPPPELRLRIGKNTRLWAKTRLESSGVTLKKILVVLNPGAFYGPAKRWPPFRFAELAGIFQERSEAQILIIGSSEEQNLAETISALMKAPPVILSGKTSLLQLAGVLSLADLLVTNDSGPMHLANAMKVPVVAIFGPTDPAATGPLQQPSTVVQKKVSCWPCRHRECPTDHKCLLDISAEDVFLASKRFLK